MIEIQLPYIYNTAIKSNGELKGPGRRDPVEEKKNKDTQTYTDYLKSTTCFTCNKCLRAPTDSFFSCSFLLTFFLLTCYFGTPHKVIAMKDFWINRKDFMIPRCEMNKKV